MIADVAIRITRPYSRRRSRFQKEGPSTVKLGSVIKRSVSTRWEVITPQLMGRAAIRPKGAKKKWHM